MQHPARPSSAPPRALFVSYLFPPVGGIGVHRVTKFVKFLPEFGWESSVLTAANPSVPLFDASLLGDVPASTIVRKARTLEPGYAVKSVISRSQERAFGGSRAGPWIKALARRVGNAVLQPDPQILWRAGAVREGMRLLDAVAHEVVIATGPPFSSFLVGAALAERSGLPLVLDYRDEWELSNAYWENKRHGQLLSWVQRRMQRGVVGAASALLATTPSSAAALERIAVECGSRARSVCIYNGFDPADFGGPRPGKEDLGHGTERMRLAFVGTLWNLNSVAPLVAAVAQLASTRPELATQLEVVLVGRKTADQEGLIEQLRGLPCRVVSLPFVAHSAAVALMRGSDALLVLNADLPHAHRIINGKMFEYLAARRPLFVVTPPGDSWDLVRDRPATFLHAPGDAEGLARALASAVEGHLRGAGREDVEWSLARFERRALTGELAALLGRLVRHK